MKGTGWDQGLLLQDEWANSLTHGIGLLLSLVGLLFLIFFSLIAGDFWKLAVLSVYGMSLVFLYFSSTVYHWLTCPNLKPLFQKIDHCAIYLLIAGSYTPFTMISLNGRWGWTLFGIEWGLAFLGIIFKTFFIYRFQRLSTFIYLAMGWLVIIAIGPLMRNVSTEALYLLFGGGLFYTSGVIFYVFDYKRYFHAIWHLFVMGGSGCHYFAILFHL